MRRVLIVTSGFAPAMGADMHRARLLSWELPRLGWDVEILTPDASYQRTEILDPDSAPFFPEDAVVHRAPAWRPGMFRRLGIGSIGWRALAPLDRLGQQLIATRRYDLVYFSTTSFPLFCLGRRWHDRFSVPYVLDFHDPWYLDTFKYVTTSRRWKFHVSRAVAKWLEAYAVRRAAGMVAVSPVFLDRLTRRYDHTDAPWLAEDRHAVIPFAASQRDMYTLDRVSYSNSILPQDNLLHVVYVGAGGAIMYPSFTAVCLELARLRTSEPVLANRIRIHLRGTMGWWQPGGPRPLQELADRLGVGDLVDEQPARVSYLESLRFAREASGLLVLGVDDPGYVPSKLVSYLLFGKPTLAAFHRESPAIPLIRNRASELTQLLTFGPADGGTALESAESWRRFIADMQQRRRVARSEALADCLAPAMAAAHVELFERCVQPASETAAAPAWTDPVGT